MDKVVVIGSGLGGLQCAYILAQAGMQVCVLEQAQALGGCLQSFHRSNCLFDTGLHYVGSLDEGQALHRLFRYFHLLDLPWHRMDEQFDDVMIDGVSYPFFMGHEAFATALGEKFPHQQTALKQYVHFLRQVGEHIFDSLQTRDVDAFYGHSLVARSAKAFLEETISDPLLRDVLCGSSLKLELHKQLPLYTFAQINNSFIESAWRLEGGGSLIAKRLAEEIQGMGGEVRTLSRVSRLIEENGKIRWVEVHGEERIPCDYVISNAHPAYTLSLIQDSAVLRNIYRNRITQLENTYGSFTANLRLRKDCIPYLNRNLYIYRHANLWHYTPGKTDRVLVSFYPPVQGDACTHLDLISPMAWSEVAAWADKPVGQRGEDYVAMKQSKTEACIRLAAEKLPGLQEAVEHVYTSTPLSYQTYTNTVQGTAFGIRKNYQNPMGTVLTPRTPIPNLLLTGQNLNLHGLLGVSMTSLLTCSELVGREYIKKRLHL